MAQYIDKSALVAEIEKRIEHNTEWKNACKTLAVLAANQAIEEDKKILSIINSLEVKEVDLEKEQRMKECPYRRIECTIYDGHILECKGACSWVVDHLKLKELKAQKGE